MSYNAKFTLMLTMHNIRKHAMNCEEAKCAWNVFNTLIETE